MRRVLLSLGVAAVLAGGLAPAAQAAPARPQIICPWSVSVVVHTVTGRYLCYA
jgi:hypothetical protein